MPPPATAGWRILLALEAATVAWLAFTPAPPQIGPDVSDKLHHAAAFAVMAGTAAFALPGRWRSSAPGLLAYGAFIEVVQFFIPSRSCEWADLLADAAGIALGLAAVSALRRVRPA